MHLNVILIHIKPQITGLKILFPLRECGFDSRPRYKRDAEYRLSLFFYTNITLCSKS